MDLSSYTGIVFDRNGYVVDMVAPRATLAEARAAAEQKFDARGWDFAWASENMLEAHHPDHSFITESVRVKEFDSKGNMIL